MDGSRLAPSQDTRLEIIAFHLGSEQFCIKTTSIREIRGWAAATPLPQAPPHVIGVMNLRGTVIPVIDLAAYLGTAGTVDTSRSAIVVAEVGGSILGLIVDTPRPFERARIPAPHACSRDPGVFACRVPEKK